MASQYSRFALWLVCILTFYEWHGHNLWKTLMAERPGLTLLVLEFSYSVDGAMF